MVSSAGEDFRALFYLNPKFSYLHPGVVQEPQPPDLFLFTDYYPSQNSSFLDIGTIYSDDRIQVIIESIEELPRLDLSLHDEIVHDPEGGPATDRAVFLIIRVESDRLGSITCSKPWSS